MPVKKILIVDEAEHNKMMKRLLKKHGYEVIESTDGEDALGKANTEDPDMIITEIDISGIDGFELVKRVILQNPLKADIPVIFLTHRAEDVDIFMSFLHGASCYNVKPINPDKIVGWVKKIFKNIEKDSAQSEV